MPQDSPAINNHQRTWLVTASTVTLVFVAAWLWYSWLFAPPRFGQWGFAVLVSLAFAPAIVVSAIASWLRPARFILIAMLACVVLLAQPESLFIRSGDVAFHAAKAHWAGLGFWAIDPVIGVRTPYPGAFHVIWGTLSRLSGVGLGSLFRWESVWNLGMLWLGCRFLAGDFVEQQFSWLIVWCAGLAIHSKDIGGYLFATPATFSIPIALAGWWLWLKGDRSTTRLWGGSLLLILAAAIWPGHLFGMAGVAAVMFLSSPRGSRFRSAAVTTGMAALVVWVMRRMASGPETWASTRLVPPDLGSYLIHAPIHLITLSSDANGALIAFGAAIATIGYLGLVYLGIRAGTITPSSEKLLQMSAGLTLGAIAASWFLLQAAYCSRLLSVALLSLSPAAAGGLGTVINRLGGRTAIRTRMLLAGFALVWLAPVVASGLVSSQWRAAWIARSGEFHDQLASVVKPGDRILAPPDTYCSLIMGSIPAMGFLAHRWPYYYGAPRNVADSIASLYDSLVNLGTNEDIIEPLRAHGVDWVLIDREFDSDLPIARAAAHELRPAIRDSVYFLYEIRESSAESQVQSD